MTRSRTRSILAPVLAGLVATGISGCASSAQPSGAARPPAASAAASDTAAPVPSQRPASSAATAVGIPNTAVLLVARPGDHGATVIEAATGGGYLGPEFQIPVGAPRPGWARVVTATIGGARTVVRDEIVQPGFGGPSLDLDGRWRLPTVGDDAAPVGVSADGSTIVLVEVEPNAGAATTRFAVVEHHLGGKPSTAGDADLHLAKTVELRGRFTYDALSSDGRILYAIEHLEAAAGGHYQVRAIDLPSGVMRDAVIVDKANPDEWMAGYPIAQLRRTDGVVMTLYDGPEHPFIHALQSTEAWALCIDLPVSLGAERSGWGIAAAPDGRTVFAANGPAGVVVEIDPDEYSVSRIASLAKTAASPFTLAKFGHSEVGPLGQQLVVLPDGSGLLVATSDGVALVSRKDLRETARIATRAAVQSIGVAPDGSVAFALTRDGRLVAFDPRSGRVLGDVAGGPYARLLAVAPW